MGVVSVRLDERDQEWLRRHGIKPGQFARLAVHEEIRRREVREASEFLAKHRIKFGRDLADMIREDRDRR